MKKQVLFTLLLTIGLFATGFAQSLKAQLPPGQGPQSKDPAAMAANRANRLKDALKLTPEQLTEVTVIMTQSTEKMMVLRKSGDRNSAREQAQIIRTEQDASIEALLDKRQLKRYLNYKASRNERGPRGGQPRPDDGK